MDAVRIEATADLKEAIASLAELREQIETEKNSFGSKSFCIGKQGQETKR